MEFDQATRYPWVRRVFMEMALVALMCDDSRLDYPTQTDIPIVRDGLPFGNARPRTLPGLPGSIGLDAEHLRRGEALYGCFRAS